MCSACGMLVTRPGVALVGVPRLLRRLAAFVGVNQVVMRAELPIVFGDDFFEQRDRFQRVLARLLARRLRSRCRWPGRASTSLRDRRDTRRPACAGRRCRRRRRRPCCPARGAPPAIRCRAARAASPCRAAPSPWRSLRARGPADRSRRRWSSAARSRRRWLQRRRRARRRRCRDRAAAGTRGGSRWPRSARCTSRPSPCPCRARAPACTTAPIPGTRTSESATRPAGRTCARPRTSS